MGMQALERAILAELRRVKNDPSIKMKEIMEWSTGEIKLQEGEELVRLSEPRVNVAFKRQKK